MGFIATAVSSVVAAVSTVFGAVESTASSVAAGISSSQLGGLLGDIGSGVASLVANAGSGLESMIADVGGGIHDLVNSGFGELLNGATNILDEIDTGVKDVAKVENEIVSPIANVVDEFSTTIQDINDEIFAPITKVISSFQSESTSLLSSVQADIHSGFTGILKLPQDLSNSFESVDAQFARATQELGAANQHIAADTIVPGLSDGIGGHLDAIKEILAGPQEAPVTTPYVLDKIALAEHLDMGKVLEEVLKHIDEIEHYNGAFSGIISSFWNMLRSVDYILKTSELSLEPIYQHARASNPFELLSIGAATEAYRRGILSFDDWTAELAKHGVGETRRKVLYELEQFLFDPRASVELRQRGIITREAYDVLINQNNLTDEQAQALTELMQHVLSPADVASGVARGYIAANDASDMYQAALVPEHLRDIIPELEKGLTNPAKMTAMQGRVWAAADGFLTDSLLSEPTPEIKAQYDRNQAEQGFAQLDWLQHWDIPAIRWWVVAYFRGMRTLTEVEQALTAHNVPKELWSDIIDVERELPPVWLVPDIVKTGVWDASKAIPTLMKLGFSEEDATVLYNYGVAARTTTATSVASDLSKVSLGNAKKAFDDGIIDSAEYTQILLDHKYSEAAAELTVSLAQYEQQQAELKSYATALIDEVKLGQTTKSQAESNLYNLGLTTPQVEKYLERIETAKRANAKLPSEAHLEKMYKKGVISAEIALETLVLIGYSEVWAERIFEIW